MIISLIGIAISFGVPLRPDYDVVIVGAGPAGATLAFELKRRGVTVLLIDKAVFPRRKCCGGGLTVKAARLLGDGLEGIAENSVSSSMFAVSGYRLFSGDYEQTIIYTLDRQRFDHFLLRRAEQAGVEVKQGLAVTGLIEKEGCVEVTTAQGRHRGRFVIGADGSRSIVAESVHLGNHDSFVGIETEIAVGDEDLARWRSTILVDLGRTVKGYAWLFPKKDHLSVGIACPSKEAHKLKRAYADFVDSLNLSRHEIMDRSAALIPMCVGKPRVVEGRAALLGDAAGLTDPLTGEGIYNALLSAQLAAPAIEGALRRGDCDLSAYQKSVEEIIGPEIEAARFFRRIIFAMPRKMLDVARRDGRLWNAGCSLVRGDTTYSAIRGRVGTPGGLYSLLRGK